MCAISLFVDPNKLLAKNVHEYVIHKITLSPFLPANHDCFLGSIDCRDETRDARADYPTPLLAN